MQLRTEAAPEEEQGRQREPVLRLWLLQRDLWLQLQENEIREPEQARSGVRRADICEHAGDNGSEAWKNKKEHLTHNYLTDIDHIMTVKI